MVIEIETEENVTINVYILTSLILNPLSVKVIRNYY